MIEYRLQYWSYDPNDVAGPSILDLETNPMDEAELRLMLKVHGLTAPGADDMPILNVIHQVNNVNDGERVVLVDGVRYGIED